MTLPKILPACLALALLAPADDAELKAVVAKALKAANAEGMKAATHRAASPKRTTMKSRIPIAASFWPSIAYQ